MNEQISTAYRGLVEASGTPVGLHSAHCVVYRLEHENCVGCDYELGCAKFIAARLIALQAGREVRAGEDEPDVVDDASDRIVDVLQANSVQQVYALTEERRM